jgi:hypothetical protein
MAVGVPGIHYHVGVATRDLDEGMARIGETFGLTWAEEREGASDLVMATPVGDVKGGLRRVVFSFGGPMRFELLEGAPGSIWYTTERAVLHHAASWVEDLPASIELLKSDGWSVQVTNSLAEGAAIHFAYLEKPGHGRVELTDAVRRDDTLVRVGWSQWSDVLQ